jgi:hypothetical protein
VFSPGGYRDEAAGAGIVERRYTAARRERLLAGAQHQGQEGGEKSSRPSVLIGTHL